MSWNTVCLLIEFHISIWEWYDHGSSKQSCGLSSSSGRIADEPRCFQILFWGTHGEFHDQIDRTELFCPLDHWNIAPLSYPSHHHPLPFFCFANQLMYCWGIRTHPPHGKAEHAFRCVTSTWPMDTPRMQVPDPVPFRETLETGTMTETSPEFRMAPFIRELSPKANDASMERRWHRGTPYDVSWRSSGYTPTSFVFHLTSWCHITRCVTESESRNRKDCTERVPGRNGQNSARTCIL